MSDTLFSFPLLVEVTSSGTVVLPIVNIILWTRERNATWSNCYFMVSIVDLCIYMLVVIV